MIRIVSVTTAAVMLGATLLQGGCNRGDARNQAQASAPAPVLPPMPSPPVWSAALAGKSFAEAFPDATGKCDSAVDGIVGQVQGGVILVGWGWDPQAKAVVERVVLVDGAGRMVAFADGHNERGDVPRHRPDVTANDSGWTAYLPMPKEKLTAYGVLKDGRACRMGLTPQP